MTQMILDTERAQAQGQASAQYTDERRRYWDEFADSLDQWEAIRGYYQRSLRSIYGFLIPPGMRVHELGCGQGDLLASLRPSRGVGVDFSGRMVERARGLHPEFDFFQADVQEFVPNEKFDFIILSDLVNDLWDVQQALELAKHCSSPSTRIILNAYSRLWEMPRKLAEKLGLAKKQLTQNWLTKEDLQNLLY